MINFLPNLIVYIITSQTVYWCIIKINFPLMNLHNQFNFRQKSM